MIKLISWIIWGFDREISVHSMENIYWYLSQSYSQVNMRVCLCVCVCMCVCVCVRTNTWTKWNVFLISNGEFQVRWGDKHGGYGEHYWDYNHAGHVSVLTVTAVTWLF
jgi:hypothetical protein